MRLTTTLKYWPIREASLYLNISTKAFWVRSDYPEPTDKHHAEEAQCVDPGQFKKIMNELRIIIRIARQQSSILVTIGDVTRSF